MAILLVAAILVSPVFAATNVTRSLPASAVSGTSMTVNLGVVLDGATYYAVDEAVPNNWNVTAASGGGDFTAQVGRIKWACFSGCSDTSLSYNITVPASASGLYTFTGTYGSENVNETSILGNTEINVTTQVPPPVQNFTISLSPSSKAILLNASDTVNVTITSLNGYSSATALSASVPAAIAGNVTVTFSPSSVTPAANGTAVSVATISVGANTTNGTYTINVTAVGGGISKTAALTLTAGTVIVPVCGNNVTEGTEQCDGAIANRTCADVGFSSGILSCTANCTFDTTLCAGGGSDSPLTTVSITVLENRSIMNATNVVSNASVWWLNPNPAMVKITGVNITIPSNVSAMYVNASQVSLPINITALTNAYKYFNMTSVLGNVSLSDDNVSALRIKFAVEKSWINNNSIGNNTIALYRWVTAAWAKLNTTVVGSDANYIYYESRSPGFSYFGIAGDKTACPMCQSPGEWSACTAGTDGKGERSRAEYECSNATNYTCVTKTVSEFCCPTCPVAGQWSECAASQQSRTAYRCLGEATGYKCESYQETQTCVDSATALAAITRAQSAITTAKAANKNVTSAELLLLQANTAYTAGDYALARDRAVHAENAAMTALPNPAPWEILYSPLVLGIIALILIVVVVLFVMRGRLKTRTPRAPRAAPTAPRVEARPMMGTEAPRVTEPGVTCSICGGATTLRVRCTSCGKPACIRHMQTIHNKPYCTNCIRAMYKRQ